MKKYIVIKFSEHEVFIYISEAESAECALTLLLGTTRFIGSFTSDNVFGDGGFAIELRGKEYSISESVQPLVWMLTNLKALQNNN